MQSEHTLLEKWCQETWRSRAVKSSICSTHFLPSAMKWDRIKCGVSVFSSIPLWIWTMPCFSLDSLRFLWGRRTCPPKCINNGQSLDSLGSRVVTWLFAPKRPSCCSSWGKAEKMNNTFYSLQLFWGGGVDLEYSQKNPVAEEHVVSTTQPLTCRWQQTMSPTVDGIFSSLSAKKNCKAPGTQSRACRVNSSLCLGLMTLVLPSVIRCFRAQC